VFLPDLRGRDPALPLLGVRAARRAVAARPEDARAWLVLAQAYLSLGRTTTEAAGNAHLPPLAEVRHVQVVTALVQAVTRRPDLGAAHEALALLFAERGYLDLALVHRDAHLRLARRARPASSPDAGRLERLEEAAERLRREVEDAENRFVVRTDALAADPLARARVALRLGLAGKALDVLLSSHADLYGVEGLRLLLELLLTTGRAQDARDLLDRDEMRANPAVLGTYDVAGGRPGGRRWVYRFGAYDWFDLCQAAGAGSYDKASAALERLRGQLGGGEALRGRLPGILAWRVTAEVGLGAVPGALALRLHARLERDRVAGWLGQADFLPVEVADLHALEGMLLLERGAPGLARPHFTRALGLYSTAHAGVPALPGRPLAERYLGRLRKAGR
jgi:tetratricopeptide (TPR) repeat protein